MPKFLFILFAFLWSANFVAAQEIPVQTDSVAVNQYQYRRYRPDSATLARQKFSTDSIVHHTWVLPDSLINKNALLDTIEKEYLIPNT
jgi:hypothetical protein